MLIEPRPNPIQISEKHFPEITFLPKTLGRNYIILSVPFPERALARNYICSKAHLSEITFISSKTYFPEFTFGRNSISPKTYFLEFTLARNYIWPKLHSPKTYLLEFALARIYIWPKLRFFARTYFPKIMHRSILAILFPTMKFHLVKFAYLNIYWFLYLHYLTL